MKVRVEVHIFGQLCEGFDLVLGLQFLKLSMENCRR